MQQDELSQARQENHHPSAIILRQAHSILDSSSVSFDIENYVLN
jgi:hypothetical protein